MRREVSDGVKAEFVIAAAAAVEVGRMNAIVIRGRWNRGLRFKKMGVVGSSHRVDAELFELLSEECVG